MNLAMWLTAGAIFGWITYARFGMNAGRGLIVSTLIGVGAAFFGANVIAPLFGTPPLMSGDFSLIALLLASVTAVASLMLADLVYERFGF
jgi:uncharacterized membrane protein YeaQ/YmgE (transglycosylase-associated protein family)